MHDLLRCVQTNIRMLLGWLRVEGTYNTSQTLHRGAAFNLYSDCAIELIAHR
jgi:hypothetical protein